MKKIFWTIVCAVSAFVSGMFLYEGGKLFLWYGDRRQGLAVLLAGAAVAVLYFWGIYRIFKTEEGREKRTKIREFILSYAAFGCAAAGIVMYIMRFHTLAEGVPAAIPIMGAAAVIAVVGFLINTAEK